MHWIKQMSYEKVDKCDESTLHVDNTEDDRPMKFPQLAI